MSPARVGRLSPIAIALCLIVFSVDGPGGAVSFVLTGPRQGSRAGTSSIMSFPRHRRCGGRRLGCSRRSYGDVGVRGKRRSVGGVAIAMSTIDEAEAIAARAAAKVYMSTTVHGYT